MRILELFAGIGACSKALERLGFNVEIVDAVEIDKYAIASFNAIHNTNFEVQDIKEWNKDLKDIDLITHGSPCQDFSVAGKQAGGDINSGTRSSLMYETIRIVGKLRPKYVLWENVKNLLSKKHKHNFDAYIETMNILGYNSYYEVLNAKDYGIPQNRERVYTISIRKDIDKIDFRFPEKEELKLRLKDMLEDEVEEKYYLSNTQIEKIVNSDFMQEKKRIQEKDYSDTILARDWKDPKCVQVGKLDIKGHDCIKRVYSQDGISPTLTDMQGGNRQPKILEDFYKGRPVREYEEVAPTLRSERIGLKVVDTYSPYVNKKYEEFYKEKGYIPEMFNPYNKAEIKDIAPTLTAQGDSITKSGTVLIKNATKKGYDEAVEGDSINLSYPESTTRRGRVGHGVAQTLQCNDSMGVVEKQRKDIKEIEKYCEYCGKQLQRKRFNGRLEDFTVFSNRKYCNRECMKRAYLKIGEYSQNWSNAHTTARKINELILHKEVCELCGSDTNLDIHHIDGNWQNNNLENLMCLCRSCHTKYEKNKNNVDTGFRIRKLTPRETWRLMRL